MSQHRLALYAPLKSPDHPIASGDRTIARLLVEALRAVDYSVDLPSHFRSFEGEGCIVVQRRLRQTGRAEARSLVRHYLAQAECERPTVWFTYHLYHKAPDWIGPLVSRALGIPYVLAEASYADKQRTGPWSSGLASTRQAICRADAVFALNPRDIDALVALRGSRDAIHRLRPFLDTRVFAGPRYRDRPRLASRHGLPPDVPWLISVGMVREGDKLASFSMQASVLSALTHRAWHWIVVGDGDASDLLDAVLAPLGNRVTRLGALDRDVVSTWLRNADLAVWPAINEAIGMALLEAQAAGLPVLAGHTAGVASICDNPGCKVVAQNHDALAGALDALLEQADRLPGLGEIARRSVNSLSSAGGELRRVLDALPTSIR